MRLLWICLGGAIGTGARYLLSGWLLRAWGSEFSHGTLVVNVLGSFLIGVLMPVALATDTFSPTLRIFLATGVLGGFTTYSTFNYETLSYFEEGAWLQGSLNLGVTVVSCLLAGAAGLLLGKLMAAR